MARYILNKMHVTNFGVIGSQEKNLREAWSAYFTVTQKNKVRRIKQRIKLDMFSTVIGYSDSAADIPFLCLCDKKTIVNPTQRNLRKFTQAFGNDMLVVTWH